MRGSYLGVVAVLMGAVHAAEKGSRIPRIFELSMAFAFPCHISIAAPADKRGAEAKGVRAC